MQDIHAQLRSAGLVVDGPLEYGRLVRCKAEGDRGGKRSGWYVLHSLRVGDSDVTIGRFGNWKLYGGEALKIEFSAPASGEMLVRLREEQERIRETVAEERKAREAEAAQRAARIFEKLPDSGRSPYLDRKKVRAFGIKFSRGSIVIPVRNIRGQLVGLQFIGPDGDKKFLTGTPKRGCFHLIGGIAQDHSLVIAEGYATAASIHMATGLSVAVAFDAGNLLPVAEAIRACYEGQPLIIAADNDSGTDGNPGLTKALAAARAVGARVCWPRFDEAAA